MESSPELKDLPLLAPTEWRVFSILARLSEPVTIKQLEAELATRRDGEAEPMTYAFILALVQRLIKKGYAAQRPMKGTNAHLYWILQPFDAVLRRQTDRALAELSLGERTALLTIRDILDESLSRSD